MEQVAEVVQRAVAKCSTGEQQRPTTKVLPEKIVSQIFKRLRAQYGHKFESLFKTPEALDEALAEWAFGLRDLTTEQISTGLRLCVDERDSEWPPALAEFKAYCLKQHQEGPDRPPIYQRRKAVIDEGQRQRNRYAQEAAINECRRLLGVKND